MTETDILLVAFFLKLFKAGVALVMVWAMLRLFDKIGGIKFDVKTRGDVYFGSRFVGACLLMGLLLG